jgi:hypothetical protein
MYIIPHIPETPKNTVTAKTEFKGTCVNADIINAVLKYTIVGVENAELTLAARRSGTMGLDEKVSIRQTANQ